MDVFLDESGQFSKRSVGDYFVVGSFTVGNPRRTEKQFRSWQRSRFPRKMRHQPEIKFSEKNVDDKLRIRTLEHIASLDVRIRYSFLRCDSIPFMYWKKGALQSGLLYANVVGETVDQYLPSKENEFRIFCDRRHLKGITKSEFESALGARVLPQMQEKSIVQVEMIDSAANANIQIVDWITGAIARYLESKPLGEECFLALRNNIVGGGMELFRTERNNKSPNS